MLNHLECEVKALLTESEFNLLIERYQDKGYFRTQDNIYFGDKKGVMKELRYGMRIRTKSNNIKLTIKIPTKDGLNEINQLIDEDIKQNIVTTLSLPSGDVKDALINVDITDKDLLIIGELHTDRLTIKDNEYVICLDKNTYKNIIDFEIEVEGPSVEKAREYLINLLKKEKIPFKENFLSKYIRATN